MAASPDLIRVQGDRDLFSQLLGVDGFELLEHTDADAGDGTFEVLGFATPAAATAIAALGATTSIALAGDDIDAQIVLVSDQITSDPMDAGDGTV